MRTRARGATPGPPPSPQDLPPRPSPQLRYPRPYLGNAKHRRLVGRLDSELLDALRKAGPDRGCRTWWGTSQSPLTCGAVARHRLQEIAVHTYDAQVTAGAPQSLPDAAGRGGNRRCRGVPVHLLRDVERWPHTPTAFDFHATEGHSWRLTVDVTAHASPVSPRPARHPKRRSARHEPPPPTRARQQPASPCAARPVSWSSSVRPCPGGGGSLTALTTRPLGGIT
ncbi:maleylpyruvate isomerase N-terminal domain-containing protein [Streptomyces sp. WM4235]|uniref:maleylpyruvate isomerase N-terminal domain-containing protein n=1 Tax=Streptomyces sp. WM4235 TaxID=1415551 RepID=UPI000AFD2017|nr:maleylpyruvate isomerase N-terminal domain-containing protein [Streptomyces sp. WM4235]